MLVAACLQPGPPPAGRTLLPGREAVAPRVVRVGDDVHVIYETAKRTGEPDPEAPRLWTVPFAGGIPGKLADNGARPLYVDGQGVAFVLHDLEKQDGVSGVQWEPGRRANLQRVQLGSGERLEDIPDVTNFSFLGGNSFFFQTFLATEFFNPVSAGRPKAGPGFVVDSEGKRRELELVREAKVGSRGGLYFLTSSNQAFHLPWPDAHVEPLPLSNVRRYWIEPGDKRVLAETGSPEQTVEPRMLSMPPRWLLADLEEKTVVPIDLPPATQFLGFGPRDRRLYFLDVTDRFRWRLHAVHAAVTDHEVLDVPLRKDDAFVVSGQGDIGIDLRWAPAGDVAVLHTGEAVFAFRPTVDPTLRRVGVHALHPAFSPDGRFLLYQTPTRPTSEDSWQLVAQDIGFLAPPRPLSPAGAAWFSLRFVEGDDPVGYLTELASDTYDFYVANPASGAYRLVAKGVGRTFVRISDDDFSALTHLQTSGRRALAITEWSTQDRNGTLVLFDLITGAEQVLAHAVSDFAVARPCPTCRLLDPGAPAALVVRHRNPWQQDGLRAMTLP